MNNLGVQQKMQSFMESSLNPKLKEPALDIQMDPNTIVSQKFQNREALEKLLTSCLQKIEDMFSIVKTNTHLQKYFAKAGTNRGQMMGVLNKLQVNMAIIREKLRYKNTNVGVIAEILVFMDQILRDNNVTEMTQNIDKAIWIVEFESKVICCFQFIMTSLSLPYDITTMKKQSFKHVWDKVIVSPFGNSEKIKNKFNFAKKILAITTSACINQKQCQWAISKLVSFGVSFPGYLLANKQCQLRSMMFYRKPNVQMANHIWNLPQNGAIRELAKFNMKSIQTNIKLYIPAIKHKLPDDIMVQQQNTITVRLLSNNKLKLKNKNRSKFLLCGPQIQNQADIDTIVLHMHGGGFLALSSRSMQVYTRRWAIKLGIPVFSIDYRMPPDFRFPTAPIDCLTVYQFLIKHIHHYFNIRPKKIILAGDSAGGNIALALTGLILKQKLPIPHGILAVYPATDLQKKFSPSKIYAFTDPLLNPTMLLLCLSEYLGGVTEYETDPMASPIFMTEQFVNGTRGDKRFPLKWPKTIFMVGQKDPLYDDTMKMMERLVSSNIDCKCFVYSNLSHGFLNLEFVIPECTTTIDDSITHLMELLQ